VVHTRQQEIHSGEIGLLMKSRNIRKNADQLNPRDPKVAPKNVVASEKGSRRLDPCATIFLETHGICGRLSHSGGPS
jgi:hypothetical protein